MAKNVFIIRALLQQEPKSIIEISNTLISVLTDLGKIDDVFLSFRFSKEKFDDVDININTLGFKEAKNKLAELILTSNLSDIKKYDEEINPTINFSRQFGFSHLLKFSSKGKELFSITGNLGTNSYPNFRLEYFYSDKEFSFKWYEAVLKCITKNLSPIYSAVTIRLNNFVEATNKLGVAHPLGWITFFSFNYLRIPKDLDLEYEYTESGVYLFLTRDDITINKECFLDNSMKLLALMEKLKETLPEFALRSRFGS
jgi:hypothetical protein